jgi:hypothetical protein
MGTFKWQYSRYGPVNRDRFIPKEKRLAEPMLTCFFIQTLRANFRRGITDTKVCSDDSHKRPDMLMLEDGQWRGIQITQLVFTRFEERAASSKTIAHAMADAIYKAVQPQTPVIVNVYPTVLKGENAMEGVNKKGKLQAELATFIIEALKKNLSDLHPGMPPIHVAIDAPKLAPHFHHLAFNPLPVKAVSRFPSSGNISVNYDQDDVAYNDNDIAEAIDYIFNKKNNGSSEILLVWADNFGLDFRQRQIATSLALKFSGSSFEEVYLMTFANHASCMKETINLWPLKASRSYIRVPIQCYY